MKTIKDLNSKWWYRLLTVILYISLIFGGGVFITKAYSNYNQKLIKDQSYIMCSGFPKVTFDELANSKVAYNVYKYLSGFGYFVSVEPIRIEKEDLNKGCKNIGGIASEDNQLVLVYTNMNWVRFILDIVLTLLVILIASELIKRIFYYITLGTINPKKE